MEGFVSIHRKILEWEWWTDHNTTRLFLYIIIKANFKDNRWQGIVIKRGQFVTSISKISQETGLSPRAVRTSLQKLNFSQETTSKTTNRFTTITVCKYDSYQQQFFSNDKQIDKQMTNKRQTNDKQMTNKRQQLNNDNNDNNKIKEIKGNFFDFLNSLDYENWKTDMGQFMRPIFEKFNKEYPKIFKGSKLVEAVDFAIDNNYTIKDPKSHWINLFTKIINSQIGG